MTNFSLHWNPRENGEEIPGLALRNSDSGTLSWGLEIPLPTPTPQSDYDQIMVVQTQHNEIPLQRKIVSPSPHT